VNQKKTKREVIDFIPDVHWSFLIVAVKNC